MLQGRINMTFHHWKGKFSHRDSVLASNIADKCGCWQNSRSVYCVCKQKRITVDENFLRSLLVAPFLLPGAFLLVVLIVLAAAAHVLVAAHTHLIFVVLVTINLRLVL